jgi:hypothetical protein
MPILQDSKIDPKRKKQALIEGKKGRGKKMAAELLLKAITKEIEAVICRAPEFTDRENQRTD